MLQFVERDLGFDGYTIAEVLLGNDTLDIGDVFLALAAISFATQDGERDFDPLALRPVPDRGEFPTQFDEALFANRTSTGDEGEPAGAWRLNRERGLAVDGEGAQVETLRVNPRGEELPIERTLQHDPHAGLAQLALIVRRDAKLVRRHRPPSAAAALDHRLETTRRQIGREDRLHRRDPPPERDRIGQETGFPAVEMSNCRRRQSNAVQRRRNL